MGSSVGSGHLILVKGTLTARQSARYEGPEIPKSCSSESSVSGRGKKGEMSRMVSKKGVCKRHQRERTLVCPVEAAQCPQKRGS